MYSAPSRVLVKRATYGGRKGRRAWKRLLAMRLSEVIAGGVELQVRPRGQAATAEDLVEAAQLIAMGREAGWAP